MELPLNYRDIPLFKYLTDSDCEQIKARALPVKKKPGEALALAGESVNSIFVVIQGEVGVYPPGAKKAFSRLTAGSAFGEMSFLDGSKASATIRVEAQDTEVTSLTHTLLTEIVQKNPSIGAALYRGIAVSVAQKLRSTNEKIAREVADTHKNLLTNQLGKSTDGASVIDRLSEKTTQQMASLTTKLADLKKIADALSDKIPEKATELTAFGKDLSAINEVIRSTMTDFKAQMTNLHSFVAAIEKSIQH